MQSNQGIRGVKLTSGQDLIADVSVDEYTKDVTLNQPFVIALNQTPDGRLATGLMPFAFFQESEPSVTIKGEHVLFTYQIANSLETYYREQTGRVALVSAR